MYFVSLTALLVRILQFWTLRVSRVVVDPSSLYSKSLYQRLFADRVRQVCTGTPRYCLPAQPFCCGVYELLVLRLAFAISTDRVYGTGATLRFDFDLESLLDATARPGSLTWSPSPVSSRTIVLSSSGLVRSQGCLTGVTGAFGGRQQQRMTRSSWM